MQEIARKDVRRATPSGSGNDGATQSNNINIYDVLGIIFRYLNARDLARVTTVCRLWLEAANYEKRSRGPCHCIINRDKIDDLISYIKNIRINPSIGFFFLPDDLSYDVEDLIYDLLPKHCEVIILYCPKSIIVDEEKRLELVETIKLFRVEDAGKRKENLKFIYNQIDLLNITYRPLPNIICAFLPQIPNMRVKSYKMETSSFTAVNSANSRTIINKIVNFVTSMSNHKTSKTYVILFCKMDGYLTAKDFENILNQTSQKNKIAPICGSLVQDICSSYITSDNVRRKEYPNFTAIMLTGSIQMWSIYFDMTLHEIPFCDINAQIEERLNLFKNKVVLKRHSIGFMFTSPRIEIYEQVIVEQEIFKRLFPKVKPLVVCYDYGQFSEEIVSKEIEVDEDESIDKVGYVTSVTRFCTMFMILTYG